MAGDTMILRFRDLGIATGETIARHTAIRESKGYVWWGWWHKQGEKVPANRFAAELASIRAASEKSVYLFDSGTSRVYRATCTDLKWQPDCSPMTAPSRGAATPTYYKKLECLAWFKFTGVEECDEAELQNYSYRRVDEFFESGESRFLPYYDKIVYSAAELQDQNRTIWFVSARVDTDRENETRPPDGPTAPVVPFPRGYQQSPSRRLLWLSDVHFDPGRSTGSRARRTSNHAFAIETTEGHPSLAESIKRSVKGYLPSGAFDIGGVLLTGDLTWQAAPAEFELAYQLLEQVKVWGAIESGHLLVIPGNHDLAFTKKPAEKDLQSPRLSRNTAASTRSLVAV